VSLIRIKLPKPPPGQVWCTACAAFYKGAFIQAHAAELNAADKDGKRGIIEFKADGTEGYDSKIFLEIGVAWGLWPDASMKARGYVFPVLLCWSHVEGIALMDPGALTQAPAGSEDAVATGMARMGVPVPGVPKQARERPSHFTKPDGG